MTGAPSIDQNGFRRLLSRNVSLPLALGVASALVFVAVISYLLSVLAAVEHSQKLLGQSNLVIKLAVDQESGVRGFMLTNDESFLAPYSLGSARTVPAMNALIEMSEDDPAQVQRLRQVMALQAQWERFAQDGIALTRAQGDVVGFVRSRRGKIIFDEIREQFSQFQVLEQRQLVARSDSAQRVIRFGVGLYLILSLAVAGLVAWFGRRDLLRLSTIFGDSIEQQRKHAEQLERQAWQRTGQTQLAERSIGQHALARLGQSVLDFVVDYTGATVGALYAREEGGELRRVSGHGVPGWQQAQSADAGLENSLVGQALDSGKVMVVGEVPDHYLKVETGLGSTSPRHIVLVPTGNDGVGNGVLELGFMQLPAPRALEFVELVAPAIGRAIEGALARRRLQDVLAESQQLNEELQVQQEELRTANEELEAQSRVLEESQTILENQKAELEQTNEQLADQASVLDQKNTALGEAQRLLEEKARDLQRASKYKSEFLANMSHELRTPLNSSLILAKLLSDNAKGNLEPEQIQFANTIYAAGNDLLRLINDILDISKVEAGKLELAPEVLSLGSLAESMHMTFAPLAGQKHLTFTASLDASAPPTVLTDHQRLQQILKNLLSNAIKFTDAGQVTLTIEGRADGQVAFAVRDSGIGIAADQQSIIFEAFRQADGSTSRRYGGTGLGLSISRDLAGLLGGSIEINSTPGKGSTFTLLLPAELTLDASEQAPAFAMVPAATAAAGAPASAPAISPAPGFPDDRDRDSANLRSVLVIEDDVSFARILYELAHEMQYRCFVAHSAADGLAMASQLQPAAILLDLGLPDGSGLDVLQKLKNNPDARHIPVHIVSATDRAEAALQLGAIGYVVKPATRERLQQVFQALEGKSSQKLKRVLLVEDDERQRASVVALINDDDVEIVAVASGAEALALLRNGVYDCMIIDLKLPDMHGHELLRTMASDDLCAFPPVIVYTGRNLTRAEENELLKYSRSIIIKGARSPERLLDEVTLFLHKVEAQMSPERRSMLRNVRSRDRVFDGRRILLVDDDVRNIFSLTSALEQKGIVVEVGRNGVEALERLDANPDMDLVLMDIMMPVMDGLEATRRLRADPRFAKLPVIAITAKAMKDDQEQCLAAGASDYLAKPIDLDRLYSLLRVWLPNMERL